MRLYNRPLKLARLLRIVVILFLGGGGLLVYSARVQNERVNRQELRILVEWNRATAFVRSVRHGKETGFYTFRLYGMYCGGKGRWIVPDSRNPFVRLYYTFRRRERGLVLA